MYHPVQFQDEFDVTRDGNSFGYAQFIVANLYGVPVADLFAPTRGGERTAFARQVAMYLMRVVCQHSLNDIGLAFGRHRSTVAYACRKLEDLRDDPVIDRQLTELEQRLVSHDARKAQP